MQKFLQRVSLTGPDEKTSLSDLEQLSQLYPFIEWALLYVPHNEGAPRNPGQAWRKAFFNAALPGYSAVHLCGDLAFEQLLKQALPEEISKASRIQLNINARKQTFDDATVLNVYKRSLDLGPDIILQYHENTAHIIAQFMDSLPSEDKWRVHILMDASKGKGVTPDSWQNAGIKDVYYGFAGGLGPGKILPALEIIEQYQTPYWIDMESNIRTNNEFDIVKAQSVLNDANKFLQKAPTMRIK